jgi:hypothetical protein
LLNFIAFLGFAKLARHSFLEFFNRSFGFSQKARVVYLIAILVGIEMSQSHIQSDRFTRRCGVDALKRQGFQTSRYLLVNKAEGIADGYSALQISLAKTSHHHRDRDDDNLSSGCDYGSGDRAGVDRVENRVNMEYLHLERWQSGRMRPT